MRKQVKAIISALVAVILTIILWGCASGEDDNLKMNIDYGKRTDGSSYEKYNCEAQEFFGVVEGKEKYKF